MILINIQVSRLKVKVKLHAIEERRGKYFTNISYMLHTNHIFKNSDTANSQKEV